MFFFLQIPETYDIISVIDLFYKLHFVFDVDFEPNVSPMMVFLQRFVYNMIDRNRTPTNRMKEFWHKVNMVADNNASIR